MSISYAVKNTEGAQADIFQYCSISCHLHLEHTLNNPLCSARILKAPKIRTTGIHFPNVRKSFIIFRWDHTSYLLPVPTSCVFFQLSTIDASLCICLGNISLLNLKHVLFCYPAGRAFLYLNRSRLHVIWANLLLSFRCHQQFFRRCQQTLYNCLCSSLWFSSYTALWQLHFFFLPSAEISTQMCHVHISRFMLFWFCWSVSYIITSLSETS